MKLTFLGTRGEIEARTSRHCMHSSLMVSYQGSEVMVDCGADWLCQINDLRPKAIFITHAHPDHSWGLKGGAPCPVYAPEETWRLIQDYDVRGRHVVEHQTAIKVGGIVFEAFPVEHSIRAPAVGYRISGGAGGHLLRAGRRPHPRSGAGFKGSKAVRGRRSHRRTFHSAQPGRRPLRPRTDSHTAPGARKRGCRVRSSPIAARNSSPATSPPWSPESRRWRVSTGSEPKRVRRHGSSLAVGGERFLCRNFRTWRSSSGT
jgi:hypothetical protein